MKPIISLRQVNPSDAGLLRALAIETYTETFGPYNTVDNMQQYFDEAFSIEQLHRDIAEQGAFNYLATISGEDAGLLRLRLNNEAEAKLGPSSIELQRLYVLAKYKGRGVGSALMNESLRIASELQKEWLWLGVWERNFAAQRFYASFGFERFGEHIFQQGEDAQVDWLLRKRL